MEATRKSVLIVENDKTVRDVLARLVSRMGYEMIVVERATRAVSVLSERPVDAMLLDLHMPGPHGQDLLRFLQKRKISAPPTIVVSGFINNDSISSLIDLGVCGIIAKPFEPERLAGELERVLEDGDEGGLLFCPQCGTFARSGDRFCRECGDALKREPTCQACRRVCNAEDKFCGHCGGELRADPATDSGEG
tara:strand:- start:44 stop:622 length:579 start_codon:yes stop_codon:yes gene_type:complete